MASSSFRLLWIGENNSRDFPTVERAIRFANFHAPAIHKRRDNLRLTQGFMSERIRSIICALCVVKHLAAVLFPAPMAPIKTNHWLRTMLERDHATSLEFRLQRCLCVDSPGGGTSTPLLPHLAEKTVDPRINLRSPGDC